MKLFLSVTKNIFVKLFFRIPNCLYHTKKNFVKNFFKFKRFRNIKVIKLTFKFAWQQRIQSIWDIFVHFNHDESLAPQSCGRGFFVHCPHIRQNTFSFFAHSWHLKFINFLNLIFFSVTFRLHKMKVIIFSLFFVFTNAGNFFSTFLTILLPFSVNNAHAILADFYVQIFAFKF